MSNAYTKQLKLNQWAASDSFVRTEFNRDNEILEGAFTGLDGRAGLLERQVEPLGYNLYNLLLQNYYDGKYTGYKKSLIFDGFRDASMLAAVTPGAYHDPVAKHVRVLSAGAANIDTGFCVEAGVNTQNENNYYSIGWIGAGGFRDLDFTPSGYGRLGSVRFRLARGSTDTVYAKVEVLDGKAVAAVSASVTVASDKFADYTFTFPGGVPVLGLHPYTLRLSRAEPEKYYLCAAANPARNGLGAVLSFTAQNYTAGSITTPVCNIGRNYDRALCWVRHTGSVGVSIKGGGAFLPLTKVSTRLTTALTGEDCTESHFRLDAAPAAPNSEATVKLDLNTGGSACTVYDYGVLFL